MNRRIRVTYVIPTMRVGGSEKQLLHLLRGLSHDFDVSLVCTRSEGPLIGDVRRIIPYVRVLNFRSAWDFRVERRLRNIFAAHPPDILHTFMFGFDLFANRAARRAGVPVVVSSRRELATWQKARHLFVQRRATRYVDCIVANSQAVAEYVCAHEQIQPDLIRVIPNGIQVEEFSVRAAPEDLRKRFGLPLDKSIVGMVANFSPVKDHCLFVDTADVLLRRRNDVHFVLVGTGPLVDAIRRRVVRCGRADSFNRYSTLREVAELHRVMDIFVLTSKIEGFPNAVMEAMASERPVVAPNVGGVRELICDGETGRLVSSRRPEDFADAVEWFLDRPEERRAMGNRARAWVAAHLSMEAMVDRYRALYHDLLQHAAARGV